MGNRIEPFQVTVPAGTLSTAFQRTDLTFQDGIVERIEIVVPPGPSGLVGFRIAQSGQQVIPYTGNVWIITDDEKINWEVSGFPARGKYQLWAYNTDIFDHTLYVRLHVRDTGDAPVITVPFLDLTPLMDAQLEDEVI